MGVEGVICGAPFAEISSFVGEVRVIGILGNAFGERCCEVVSIELDAVFAWANVHEFAQPFVGIAFLGELGEAEAYGCGMILGVIVDIHKLASD